MLPEDVVALGPNGEVHGFLVPTDTKGFEARLSRAAAYQLLALADYDERSGRGALRLGGREYALARAS